MVRKSLQQMLKIRLGHPTGPWRDRAARERTLWVRHDQIRIDLELGAEPITRRARAIGAIEGEGAGLDLVDTDRMTIRARHVLGEATHPVRIIIR